MRKKRAKVVRTKERRRNMRETVGKKKKDGRRKRVQQKQGERVNG